MIPTTVIILLGLFIIQDSTCESLMYKYARSVDTNKFTPQSPCPTVFQYQNDDNGELIGAIKVNKADQDGKVLLDVELSVGNSVQGYNGKIVLAEDKQKVINAITHGNPIFYRVLFPAWQNLPPRVTKILANGNQICSGEKIPIEIVPVVTMINLQHKLSLGVTPPVNGYNPPAPPETGPHYPVDIRTETIPVIKPGTNKNPYNFNPPSRKPSLDHRPPPGHRPPPDHRPPPNALPDDPFVKPPPSSVIGGHNVDDFPIRVQTTNRPPKIGSSNRLCGRPTATNSLIVNGRDVARGAYPWLVGIFKQSEGLSLQFICAGSLISDRHVVTAAHCFRLEEKTIKANEIVCVFGKLNIRKWITSSEERISEPDSIIVHPDYQIGKANADIAIMVFQESIPFNTVIKPVCLWQGSVEITQVVGHIGTVVGWGRDENGDLSSAEPKQVTMPIIGQFECLTGSSPSVGQAFIEIVSTNTFCAGFRNGSGPCNGDSGSAFLLKRDGVYYLRGVVSTALSEVSQKTCNLQEYVVFTDAAKYLGWITNILTQK